jgi:hypothetical protein
MRIALRLLIVAYVVAAIAWGIALTPPRLFPEDAGWLIVIGFGYSQVLLALLFLISAVASAVVLIRASAARSLRSFVVFGLALVRSNLSLFVVLLLRVTHTMGLTIR